MHGVPPTWMKAHRVNHTQPGNAGTEGGTEGRREGGLVYMQHSQGNNTPKATCKGGVIYGWYYRLCYKDGAERKENVLVIKDFLPPKLITQPHTRLNSITL